MYRKVHVQEGSSGVHFLKYSFIIEKTMYINVHTMYEVRFKLKYL